MSASAAPPYYDPYDAGIDADPYPVWRRLRDEAPLYYNEQHDFYALSRFADVLAASLDWQTYSSARGHRRSRSSTPSRRSPDAPEADPSLGMMIFMDPPRHDELRRLVSRAFTPRRVTALDARIRELCAEFLEPRRGELAASTSSRTSRRRSRRWSSARCSACRRTTRTSSASGAT